MPIRLPKIPGAVLILLLVAASLGIYLNSLPGEFLIDDYSGIVNNTRIHDLESYFSGRHFRLAPGALTELLHVVIWRLGGGRPFLFHLFSLIAHAACVVLVFILCNILFGNAALSFLASLIFAIHPIHTEPVSWIAAGPYVFSSLFFLAALIFYIKSADSPLNLTLAALFFSLSLLTASPSAALPLIFIVYDLFFRPKAKDTNVFLTRFRKVFLFLILVIAGALAAIFFIMRNRFMHAIFYFRGPSYLVVIAKAFAYYLKILYLPIQRGLYHPFAYNTADINKISPAFFISLAIILGMLVAFFRCRRSAVPVSFGIAFFLVTYLPYSNIIPVCNIVSERYLYLPSVGFCIVLAWLFLKAWEIINRGAWRPVLRITAILILALFLSSYAILAVRHNYDYKDIITYWESNVTNFPDGYMAYNNLAGTYYALGEKEQAIGYAWITLMINPKQPHVWYNLGKVYREQGNIKQALYCYREALKLDKGFLPASFAINQIAKEDK